MNERTQQDEVMTPEQWFLITYPRQLKSYFAHSRLMSEYAQYYHTAMLSQQKSEEMMDADEWYSKMGDLSTQAGKDWLNKVLNGGFMMVVQQYGDYVSAYKSQAVQVDGEKVAVEFAEWIERTYLNGWKFEKTPAELFAIYNSRN